MSLYPSSSKQNVESCIKEHESMQRRDVTFSIEDRRFRVPIQLFSESTTFCAMLESAADGDAGQAIDLDGISKDDFLCFVRYIYVHRRKLVNQSVIDLAGYTALLKLSTKWRFDIVRAEAIRDFPYVDVVDKIILARDYGVRQWLVTSLNDYARLPRSITLEDVQRLGLNYILKITQVREKFHQDESPFSSEAHQRRAFDFGPSLAELFHEEIKRSSIELPPVTPSAIEDFDLVDIFFLVEDHLFKSYRQCFESSPVFRTMFSLPVGENNIHDGVTKSQPLRLEGVAKVDFAPFVALIDPGAMLEQNFSSAEWISILKLSTMWEFTWLRQHVITQLRKLGISPVMQINLARDYHVQGWLLPSLVAYAQQASPITADDIDLLGWDFVLKLLQARERMGNFNFHVNRQTVLYRREIDARAAHNFTQALEIVLRKEIEKISQMYAG